MRKNSRERLLRERLDGIFINPFEQGSGQTYSEQLAAWVWKVWCRNGAIGIIRQAGRSIG